MPRFEPFRALRYAADDLSPLLAPPYDVLTPAEVELLRDRSPHNIAWVDVPQGGPDRYRQAAETLRTWLRRGVMVRDPVPSFTIYRLRFADAAGQDRDVAGVLGALEVMDDGAGGVLPHERTTAKDSTDRLELTRATATNLSPVWGLSLRSGLAKELAQPGQPLARVVDDGVEHVVERVSDPDRLARIAELVGGDDVLIADGHHRYGVARTYRDEVRAATGRQDTPAELTLTFVSELVADQLSVEAIHRLYPRMHVDFADTFTLSESTRPTRETLTEMREQGFLVLYTRDQTSRLTPIPGAFAGVRDLDGAWLEATLGEVEVTYQHGMEAALAAVDDGRAEAAVLIRPVSVNQIEQTAREGLLMPPKSTFFTPKLKTGLVLRALDQAGAHDG